MRRLLRRVLGRQRVIENAFVEYGASPEEVNAVQAVLTGSGFSVTVRPEYPLTGGPPTELSWALYVALGVPITAFFTTLGSAAGTDAYAALKAWITRVHNARRPTRGHGEIRLVSSETSMVIPAEIPDHAIEALRRLDWSALKGGHLIWVQEEGTWRDTRDIGE
jgi:hypothetical protein